MSLFCIKKLEAPIRLGDRLKEARTKKGLTLTDLSATTRIPENYLLALEESRFQALPPAKGYCTAYLRELAKVLELNPESCLHQFFQEEGLDNTSESHPDPGVRRNHLFSLSYFVRNVLIAVFVLIFAGYLVWQVKGIMEPPFLNIFSPAEGAVMNQLSTAIQGETEKECQLSINGQEIMIDDQGRFESTVNLSEGINTITISAIKKHGRTTTITKHIIANPVTEQPLTIKK